MKLTKKYLKSLEPCRDRWRNYLKHYSTWSGSLLEFLQLDKISVKDKLWLFCKNHNNLFFRFLDIK